MKPEIQNCSKTKIGYAMKKICLLALAIVATNTILAAPVWAEKSAWAPLVSGKTTEERWATIGKTAPKLLGMTRAEVEKNLGKGSYSESQQQMTYQITDPATSKTNVYDNIFVSFDKNGKVNNFGTIAKIKD